MQLKVNESVQFIIHAKLIWNNTPLEVKINEIYSFQAHGIWRDLIFQKNANGYINWYLNLLNRFKRFKNAKWFALIGSIDHKFDFYIGVSNRVKFINSGELSFYANDAKHFYCNNSGFIKLTIKRIQ